MLSGVSTGAAPKALGPYSQAIRAGQFLFVSGQVPIDPASGELIQGGIGDQTRRALENIGEILKAGGFSFQQVVRTTVYLADLGDFGLGAELGDLLLEDGGDFCGAEIHHAAPFSTICRR